MFNFHRIFIVVLGVILSFLLFAEGEKYNFESTEYGPLIRACREKRLGCGYDGTGRPNPVFEEKYGASYWVLESNLRDQKLFVIIPCVLLIISLFVCFTLDKKEILMTALVIAPLLLNFIVRLTFGPECCLTPFYLLYAVCLSFVFSYAKRFFGFVNP